MKLMFLHPVDYGRKAEELLWRKVYYEVIQLIKTNKKAGIAGWGGQPAGPWGQAEQEAPLLGDVSSEHPALLGASGADS